jgi:uncharacterized protein YndB with AHSA1/START domain
MPPIQPAHQLPCGEDRIVIEARFQHTTPDLLFDYFVRPSLLTQWWAPRATIHARQGGEFHYTWDDLNLHLCGTYQMVERGKLLLFTWRWDRPEEAGRALRTVRISFHSCADGARLQIEHAPYAPDETADRKAHAEAWLYYLARLQALVDGDKGKKE